MPAEPGLGPCSLSFSATGVADTVEMVAVMDPKMMNVMGQKMMAVMELKMMTEMDPCRCC